jgi:GTP-binding protein LepA
VTDREILAAQRSVEEYLAIPRERMRSFGIIAHVDHGKSTLADRLLEHTGAVPKGGRKQYLDRLPVERARGITVKAQSVTLLHECPVTHETYLLNLIDTPGHADFSFEVARSLVACDGALLLVDATQGVQAQTIATFFLALENDLATLPVANKIDAPNADVKATREQMVAAFGMDIPEIRDDDCDTLSDNPHFLLRASAKTGFGVENVLAAVVRHVPPPVGKDRASATDDTKIAPRCRLLDCHYDPYRGAVSTVQVVDGVLRIGDRVVSVATGAVSEILELGFMTPEPLRTKELRGGHVGFLVTSNRDVRSATVGDTLFVAPRNAKFVVERDTDLEEDDETSSDVVTITPLPGLKSAKPMVFQGVFPSSADQFETLRAAIEKLTLNDSSVVYHPETSAALGPGFRCGFLGLLHADVFHQRLKEELGVDVVATAPNVPYRVDYGDGPLSERTKKQSPSSDEESNPELSRWRVVSSPSSFDQERLRRGGGGGVQEPVVDATIVCASDVVGGVVELCVERRGEQLEHSHLGATRVLLRYRLPLAEMASDFSDALKSRTSGYATFDYEEAGWRDADVVKLDVLVNGVVVDALSTLTHRSGAVRKGRLVTKKLRDVLPRQLFEVAVQAAVNGSIVARETVSAMRKNVIAKCYGGDVSRKKKLLSRQKEGKKKMRKIGNVDVPLEAFAGLLGGNQGR